VVVLGQEAEALSRAAGADHVLPMPFDPATLVGDILEAVANRNQANAVEDSRR